MIRANDIQVDEDEGRFCLVVHTDDTTHRFDIHSIALEFYAEVRKQIRPYVIESDEARASMPTVVRTGDTGYALDDPKHPTYHERMVD